MSVSPCNVFLALQCSLHGFFLHHYLGVQLVSIDLLSPGFWLLFVRALEILAVYLTCFPSCFMPMFSICLVWAIPKVHGEVIASGVFFPFNSSLSIGKSLILFILPCYGFKWKPTPGGSIIPLQYVGLGPVFQIVAFFFWLLHILLYIYVYFYNYICMWYVVCGMYMYMCMVCVCGMYIPKVYSIGPTWSWPVMLPRLVTLIISHQKFASKN